MRRAALWLPRLIVLLSDQIAYAMARPLIFQTSAQMAHTWMQRSLARIDGQGWPHPLLRVAHWLAFESRPCTVGGVTLPFPLILAAGLVKGEGFESEQVALDAVERGQNIMPGWRSIPLLVGPVEFGSFTRWPRLGNPGTVVWRDVPTRSTQNRVGLRNPGARAAAAFLAARRNHLPPTFGINVAVSPGVTDPEQERREVLESMAAFIERGIFPAWFTLNLSCPNTEDDPTSRQTADQARTLCRAAVDLLHRAAEPAGRAIPLWVKLGPTLADEQYRVLMQVFEEVGAQAVVATNTLPLPSPDDPTLTAGMAGGRLHARAVEVAALLMQEKERNQARLDIIGCGGVQDTATSQDFTRLGIRAVQYWSALVYRGPMAAAHLIRSVQVVNDEGSHG